MKEVRIGIVGCGGMGSQHVKWIGEVQRARLTACSDTFADNVKKVVSETGVKGYADAQEMYASGDIDAVMIATPHYFHPPLTLAAFKHGIHVLTEKPVSVTAKAAQQMNEAAAKHPELKFSAMFQMRTATIWKTIKQYVDDGKLGQLQRITWIVTDWFRTQCYYDRGGWRATWAGEGGGVLLNQCPHNLDLVCWIFGQPSLVDAHIHLAKHHTIEVEDEVNAYLEWSGGATGSFITSTGEAPGTNRLEIVGDRGRIVCEAKKNGGFTFDSFDVSVREHIRTSDKPFAKPVAKTEEIAAANDGHHRIIHQNFVDAILDNVPLIASATEGLESVELANAIIMSGLEGQTVDLPMDRDAYERLLARLIEDAKQKV